MITTSNSNSSLGETYFVLDTAQQAHVSNYYFLHEFKSLKYAEDYINNYPNGTHKVIVGYELKVNKNES